jgi:uncharacterized membrane protein/endonuclease/exonuclease/phosphatase (EEP) superfamily protein YafD
MMRQSDGGERWPARLRWLAAIFFVIAGLLHFIVPSFYRQIVPPGLPWTRLLVVVSGACEIAGGLGLLIRPLRRWAGWGLIALLVAVFPANIYMAVAPQAIAGLDTPTWLLWLRLPFQAVFIAWVWYAALRRAADRHAGFPRLADVDSLPATESSATRRASWLGLLHKLLLAAVMVYGTLLMTAWLVLHFAADHYWWATVFLYAPRWIWAIPLPLLAMVAVLRRRRLWFAWLAGLSVGAVLLADIHCPWRTLLEPATTEPHLRVLTLNCDSWSLRPDDLHRLLVELDPDIVALQDAEEAQLPAIFGDTDRAWHLDVDGYLTLASRYPIRQSANCDDPAMAGIPGAMRRYELDVDGTSVQVFNLHLMSPRWGLRTVQSIWWRGARMLQAASDGRRQQAEIAGRWIAGYQNVIVAGDFNTPAESPVFRNNFGELSSAFAVAGWGTGRTYFAGWFSLRLDHILSSQSWQAKQCRVGPNVGSEHRPLMAVFARTRED